MFDPGHNHISSVTVTEVYRRVIMREKYMVTQQFLSWKGKDRPTCV
jgi:hypothetical protein